MSTLVGWPTGVPLTVHANVGELVQLPVIVTGVPATTGLPGVPTIGWQTGALTVLTLTVTVCGGDEVPPALVAVTP